MHEQAPTYRWIVVFIATVTCSTTIRPTGCSSSSIIMDAKLPSEFWKKRRLFLITFPLPLYILVLLQQLLNPSCALCTSHRKLSNKLVFYQENLATQKKEEISMALNWVLSATCRTSTSIMNISWCIPTIFYRDKVRNNCLQLRGHKQEDIHTLQRRITVHQPNRTI